MGNHHLVQVHHLLDRRIEPSEQHVVDHEDTPRIPRSPLTPSSSLPNASLKLLMLASCRDESEYSLRWGRSLWSLEITTSVFSRLEALQVRLARVGMLQLCDRRRESTVQMLLVAHGSLA